MNGRGRENGLFVRCEECVCVCWCEREREREEDVGVILNEKVDVNQGQIV